MKKHIGLEVQAQNRFYFPSVSMWYYYRCGRIILDVYYYDFYGDLHYAGDYKHILLDNYFARGIKI